MDFSGTLPRNPPKTPLHNSGFVKLRCWGWLEPSKSSTLTYLWLYAATRPPDHDIWLTAAACMLDVASLAFCSPWHSCLLADKTWEVKSSLVRIA